MPLHNPQLLVPDFSKSTPRPGNPDTNDRRNLCLSAADRMVDLTKAEASLRPRPASAPCFRKSVDRRQHRKGMRSYGQFGKLLDPGEEPPRSMAVRRRAEPAPLPFSNKSGAREDPVLLASPEAQKASTPKARKAAPPKVEVDSTSTPPSIAGELAGSHAGEIDQPEASQSTVSVCSKAVAARAKMEMEKPQRAQSQPALAEARRKCANTRPRPGGPRQIAALGQQCPPRFARCKREGEAHCQAHRASHLAATITKLRAVRSYDALAGGLEQ